MIDHGHDPHRPVTIAPATKPGERAFIQQPLSIRRNTDGVLHYTWFAQRVDAPDHIASNAKAIAIAESMNNGMLRVHDSTDAEHDDG